MALRLSWELVTISTVFIFLILLEQSAWVFPFGAPVFFFFFWMITANWQETVFCDVWFMRNWSIDVKWSWWIFCTNPDWTTGLPFWVKLWWMGWDSSVISGNGGVKRPELWANTIPETTPAPLLKIYYKTEDLHRNWCFWKMGHDGI